MTIPGQSQAFRAWLESSDGQELLDYAVTTGLDNDDYIQLVEEWGISRDYINSAIDEAINDGY